MGTRRALVAALAIATLAGCTSGSGDGGASPSTSTDAAQVAVSAKGLRSLYDDVDPFIGTDEAGVVGAVPKGAAGDVFPGAVVPFGAVQWSPDTPNAEVPYGYGWKDTETSGFSLTHFSGAGCPNGGLFRFLPTTGDDAKTVAYSHDDEDAHPGTYRVRLANGVSVRLAATTRGGIGTFTFPAGSQPTLTLDSTTFVHTVTDPPIRADGAKAIEGTETAGNFCWTGGHFPMHLRAELDQPFELERTAKPTVSRLRFTGRPRQVRVRLAISPVSTEGAAGNLAQEVPTFDAQAIERKAARRWRELLDRVRVADGSAEQRTLLATALYHSLIHPSTWSDVDGRYPGFDGKVHTVPKGQVQLHTFSGWDIYRSQVQLLALLAPEVAKDIPTTLLRNAQACGGGFDEWSLGNVESHVMLGDPGALMMANLDAFGASTAPPKDVLAVMARSTDDPTTACQGKPLRPQWDQELELGYTPRDTSRTLEYASADAAIAAYAARHGDDALAARAAKRADNWHHNFDPSVGYVRGRIQQGDWMAFSGPTERNAFAEGNAAQYTWMVPQDVAGVVRAVGGRKAAVARLDDLFADVNAGLDQPHFYMGNEPQFTVPWAYAWAGKPAGTQAAVRKIIDEAFGTDPGGLPGNDDLGATSSWLVWALLGMYPAVPGQDVLALHTPSFPKVTLAVPGRAPLSITATGAPTQAFVASAALDGKAVDRAWLRFRDLADGGTLAFETSKAPTSWGSAAADAPPSLSD
ncbi:MAG: GH92 family glycosyl hydrolase [Acidimicrobiales bacterium]